MNKAVVAGAIVLLAGLPVCAATINVGNWVLVENTPDQTITISVTPGDPVEDVDGMVLFAQVADSGPDLMGTIDGPEFTAVDVVTGTIFESDPFPEPPVIFSGGQAATGGVVLATFLTSVPANGVLATLTVTTEGFFADDPRNPWDLKLTDTVDAPTELLHTVLVDPGPPPFYEARPIDLTVINGMITLVPIPEPSTIVMLLGVLAGVPLVWLREKHRRGAK